MTTQILKLWWNIDKKPFGDIFPAVFLVLGDIIVFMIYFFPLSSSKFD